jgi:1-acyl-sn-glycerol-3-phosphate acyltransferase
VAERVYPPVIAFARVLFRAQGLRIRVEGADNVPRTGGAVMAINHIGYLDFTFAGYAALPAGRLVRFMAKQEVFSHPVSGPLMRGMHHIPVDRAAGAASYRAALQALRASEIVGVFPEATISRSFELKEFKSGAVRMATAARVPLLPTVIWGSQRVWTKDRPRHLLRPSVPISVYVGEPLHTSRDTVEDVTQVLRQRMEMLLHQAQEEYGDRPRDNTDRWWLPTRLGGTAPTPKRAAELDEQEQQARGARSEEMPQADMP